MRQTLMALSGIIVLIATATAFAGVCGDINGNVPVNIQDITYLINYLYKSGPAPRFISQPNGTATDIDGNVYQTVAIGSTADVDRSGSTNITDVIYLIEYLYRDGQAPDCPVGQVWMTENLRVMHYRNGDSIPNVTDNTTWSGLSSGAYCDYNDDVNNVATYGRLYNWYAVNDSRNIAPAGWHVPGDTEWQTLVDYLGGEAVAGGVMKEAGTTHWESPNTGATDESGFTGLPGGVRNLEGPYFNVGYSALFWSSTRLDGVLVWGRSLGYDHSEVSHDGITDRFGLSVRCVKDPTVTDIDGNVYQTVTIGNQVWMAENLKVTHYRNGDAIPNVSDSATWAGLTTGAYCEYNNDTSKIATYGRLYNWFSLNDNRNIAPAGWHVPSDAEWQMLVDYLGGWAVAGGKMKEAGTVHWTSPNTGATNESGFSALPGGNRHYDGAYLGPGALAYFWSATGLGSDAAWLRYLYYGDSVAGAGYGSRLFGFSLRCIKD